MIAVRRIAPTDDTPARASLCDDYAEAAQRQLQQRRWQVP
jgi:hypothetical protein